MSRNGFQLHGAKFLLILLGLLLFAGCSAEHVRRGMYEGFKTRNDLKSTPSERIGKPEAPNYTEYEQFRKEQNSSR